MPDHPTSHCREPVAPDAGLAGCAARGSAVQGRWARWKMLAILLVCAAPVLASYFSYYVVRPAGRTNHGELIEPQQPMPVGLYGTALDGRAVPLHALRDQWLLVSVAGGDCEARCQGHLYFQRQLRESLGKDKDRLDWVWLITDEAPLHSHLQQALSQPGAQALRLSPPQLAQLQQWLRPAPGHALAEHLYVVDPMGNWMMRFPAGIDLENAALFRKDLDRLLRASRFWDRAGRPEPLAGTAQQSAIIASLKERNVP